MIWISYDTNLTDNEITYTMIKNLSKFFILKD